MYVKTGFAILKLAMVDMPENQSKLWSTWEHFSSFRALCKEKKDRNHLVQGFVMNMVNQVE